MTEKHVVIRDELGRYVPGCSGSNGVGAGRHPDVYSVTHFSLEMLAEVPLDSDLPEGDTNPDSLPWAQLIAKERLKRSLYHETTTEGLLNRTEGKVPDKLDVVAQISLSADEIAEIGQLVVKGLKEEKDGSNRQS